MTRKFWKHWALWFGGSIAVIAAIIGTIIAFKQSPALGFAVVSVALFACASAALASVTGK